MQNMLLKESVISDICAPTSNIKMVLESWMCLKLHKHVHNLHNFVKYFEILQMQFYVNGVPEFYIPL